MEDSYRKEIPASSSESCANELTRSNSGASSLSVANFKNTSLQSGNATTVIVYFFAISYWLNLVYLLVC